MENIPFDKVQEREIDLVEVGRFIWSRRLWIFKAAGIGCLVGVIVAFSLPKEFEARVTLAPENGEKPKGSQLSGLAAMAGIEMGGSSGGEALTVDLYPDIVASAPFLLELARIEVADRRGENFTFYRYMADAQREAWWNRFLHLPFRLAARVRGGVETGTSRPGVPESGDPYRLTAEQEGYLNAVRNRIGVAADKKSGVLHVSVRMQDPFVAAGTVKKVIESLQQYIAAYRTRKARQDLAFTEKLYREAKEAYYRIQAAYASHVDRNSYTASVSGNVEKARLQQEMDLAYGVYSQLARQREAARIKVQEQTPVYTVIEPARVPLAAVGPDRLFLTASYMAAAVLLSIGWLTVKSLIKGGKA